MDKVNFLKMIIINILVMSLLTACGLTSLINSQEPKQNATQVNNVKVWGSKNNGALVYKKIGSFHISLQKNNSYTAPVNSFVASIRDQSKPFISEFRGTCSELMAIKVNMIGIRGTNLKRFEKTHSGSDLPINEILHVTQESLSEQCEQLQVLRVKFTSTYDLSGKYNYEGTMVKGNNWKLQDGYIKTAYDSAHTFELKLRGFGTTVGINKTKVRCEDAVTLPLQTFYRNATERAFSKAPKMIDYKIVASTVKDQYLKECPETSKIHYSIKTLPKTYYCPNGEKCYLTVDKEKNWKVGLTGFINKQVERKNASQKEKALLFAGKYSSSSISQKDKNGGAALFQCPDTKTTEFDKHNSLEYLGFSASRFLLKNGNANFYEARSHSGKHTNYSLVAIHNNVADDETIIDATTRYYSNDDEVWGIQYNHKMIVNYVNSLLPCLSKLATGTTPNWIAHYTQSKRLFATKQKQTVSNIIPAPIYTRFNRDTATGIWIPRYIDRKDGVQSLGANQANTLNKVIEKRTELDVLFELGPLAGKKFLKEKANKKQENKTKLLTVEAEKKGIIYQDPSYWNEYNDRNKFQAIFNGEKYIEGTNGFAWVYITFISQYYRSCQEFIPPNSPGYDYTELTTITDNFSSSTYKSGLSKIRMKEKLFKRFKYYQGKAVIPGFKRNGAGLVGVLQTAMQVRNPDAIKLAKESLLYLRDDISRLFRDGSCKSGFLMQFEENLYRLGNNLVPLQKDNKIHPYLKNDK